MATEEELRKARAYLDSVCQKLRPYHEELAAQLKEAEKMSPEEYAAWIESSQKHWMKEELNDYFEGGPLRRGGSIDDPELLDMWLHGKTYAVL